MKKQHHNIEFFKKVLGEIFLDYKSKLRINKSWKIRLELRHGKGLFAEVVYDYKAKEFTVYVNDTMHSTLRVLKDSVIHEFWHILLTPYTAQVDELLTEASRGKVVDIAKKRKALKLAEEAMVRKFTRIIIDLEHYRKDLERQIGVLKLDEITKKVSK